MYLSELQNKDIISLKDGRKLGRIIDAEINPQGQIIFLIIETRRSIKKLFSHQEENKISYDDISKIGEDVILINMWYNETEVQKSE